MDRPLPSPIVAPPFASDVRQGEPRGYLNQRISFVMGITSILWSPKLGLRVWRLVNVLIRASRLEHYSDWTFYYGAGFVPSGGSPYDQKPPHLPCQPIVGLSGEVGSIGKLADTHLFVAFMIASHSDISEGGAVDVAFSEDLIHWSGRKSLLSLRPGWVKGPAMGWRYHYPSVLDDFSPGRNFETIGRHASLFLVRLSCVEGENMVRDLIRMPLDVGVVGR